VLWICALTKETEKICHFFTPIFGTNYVLSDFFEDFFRLPAFFIARNWAFSKNGRCGCNANNQMAVGMNAVIMTGSVFYSLGTSDWPQFGTCGMIGPLF